MSRGGKRDGAGRPLGWRKPEGTRKQRQTRAYDDEWEIIQRFIKIVKYGDKEMCKKFVDAFDVSDFRE